MKNLWKLVLVLAVALGFTAVSGCNNQSSSDEDQGAAVQPADAAGPADDAPAPPTDAAAPADAAPAAAAPAPPTDDAAAPVDGAAASPPPAGDPSVSDASNDNQDFA